MIPVAARVAAYRARQKAGGSEDTSRRYRAEHRRIYKREKSLEQRSFVGCDGEGCGVDEYGRQLYMLFRIGENELYTTKPLKTAELLSFICCSDSRALLVGFSFGYDVTMILRDLSPGQQARLFKPRVTGKGHSNFVWYKDFDIEYLPRQYFRVRRVKITRTKDGREVRTLIKGSTRTIYETFGFFQKSFLKVIQEFKIGTEDGRKRIADNKASRSAFEVITYEIRTYCEMECAYLAETMEVLRRNCFAAGIIPRSWNGAGKLAMALHAAHDTLQSKRVRELVPPDVLEFASAAYYGGRFEITRTGMINERVYEYDIRSAYPNAMRSLPCLEHGRWTKLNARALGSWKGLYVASVTFACEAVDAGVGQLGGFPVRSKDGHLYWPLKGAGVYWSPEIETARRLGFRVRSKVGWGFTTDCNCKLFDWVEPLYDYRRKIGSQGPGYPIKLAINSLYGKLAQRIGNPKYANLIWAGLITALTRSKLNVAISNAPANSVVMLATDGIYSLSPIPLSLGENLGDFEAQEFDGLFIVQPGLYWSPNKRKRKSRGLSGKFFEAAGLTESFEAKLSYWLAEQQAGIAREFPTVPVEVNNFVGLKIALARGKPETAGVWKTETRTISFDYRAKRFNHQPNDGHVITSIKPGHSGLVSVAHRDMVESGGYRPLEELRDSLAEQQEYVDLSPPFED